MLNARWTPLLFVCAAAGCSSAPEAYKVPKVDVAAASEQAVKLYDADGDGALNKDELAKCPGILGRMPAYDRNGDDKVQQAEIAEHLGRLLNRIGGTQLTATVYYKGRPLGGAAVAMEPEPYLGEAVQAARGTTDGAGTTELEIPPEFVPEHLRRLKTVHYGTFKVRITHPTIQLPAKYNTETELGYETEPGKPMVAFDLK